MYINLLYSVLAETGKEQIDISIEIGGSLFISFAKIKRLAYYLIWCGIA